MTESQPCRCEKCRLEKPLQEFQHGWVRYESICTRCLQAMGYPLKGSQA